MKKIPLRLSWAERAKLVNNEVEIYKHFEMYHITCADSCIHFINTWVMTYDPRLKGSKVIPFELFEKQEECVRFIWDRYLNDEPGVIEKSRDTGLSWLVIAIQVYLFLFKKDSSLQVFSFKAESVHRLGDISTLLQKAIFIIEHLPPLFIQGVKCSHMYLKNERMNSDIAGSSGSNPGRGARRSLILEDESAFYEQAEMVEAALSETANCRIEVSTHKSTNTLFYRKCISGMPVFKILWSDDPRKDQKWYDKKKQDAIDNGLLHVFMREVECNAAASVENVCIPSTWVDSALRHSEVRTGSKIAGFDPADEGNDVNGFCIVDGNTVVYAEEDGGGDISDVTDKFFWKAVEFGCDAFHYDPIGVGTGVKVRIKEILSALPEDHKARKMNILGWSASGKVMRPNEEDFQEKKNGELFENAKAQAHWKVREEFRNTYRMVNGKEHDDSQVVHLPSNPSRSIFKLMQELSQPQYKLSSSGKLMIDKKPKGTQSPNLCDAYILCRAEVAPTWIPWGEV